MILLCLLVGLLACSANGLLAPTYGYGAYGSPYGAYGSPYSAYGSPYSAYPAQPAIATQHQNTYRTPYNLGQVSTFSKTINTPYSSVSKSDVRVSNPGVAIGAYHGVAAPVYHGVAAPVYHGVAAPVYHGVAGPAYHGVAAPIVSAPVAKVATAGGLLGVAYSAAPAVSHMTYSNGLGLAYAW